MVVVVVLPHAHPFLHHLPQELAGVGATPGLSLSIIPTFSNKQKPVFNNTAKTNYCTHQKYCFKSIPK